MMSKQCTVAENDILETHELDVSDKLDTAWLHSPGSEDDGVLSSNQSLKMSDDDEGCQDEGDEEQQNKLIIHRLII